MRFYNKGGLIFVLLCVAGVVVGDSKSNSTNPGPQARSLGRVHIPLFGIGPTCTGCPQHYCDDDPAIIHGYCCGCARIFDNLPVRCPPFLNCPVNTHSLCEDYEYMMYCCCY